MRRADRFTQFALVASDEALKEAGWDGDDPPYDPRRVGCIVGTGIGGIGTLTHNHQVLLEQGPKKVSPLSIPLMMGNAGAGAVDHAPQAARARRSRRSRPARPARTRSARPSS